MKTKTEVKHTPGPWKYDWAQDGIFDESDTLICRMEGSADENNNEVNARLIAAAPDLLEAAKEMLVVLRTKFQVSSMPKHKAIPFNKAYAFLEATIAKADGR